MTDQKKRIETLLLFGSADGELEELGSAEGATDVGCLKALLYIRVQAPDWLRSDQICLAAKCQDADLHLLLKRGLIVKDDKGCGFIGLARTESVRYLVSV